MNNPLKSSEIVSIGGNTLLALGTESQIDSLQQISARIGKEPLLVQAATGNTSVKLGGTLWIKASGKWLAHAKTDEIMIPVDLSETRRRIELNIDPAGQTAVVNGRQLGTSVETAMHAVLPWSVVLHVHSVNTIAWAVRRDGAAGIAERLQGIEWQWIPYVASGMPLARAIQQALVRDPRTRVLVLANHGLVVCGESCEAAEALLNEVENRVALAPRNTPSPNWQRLAQMAGESSWELPHSYAVHSLATDEVARRAIAAGILYPCQAIFLTAEARVLPRTTSAADLMAFPEPFAPIEDTGVLVRANAHPAQSATLDGLAEVVRRIPDSAPVQYLRCDQVRDLLCADVYHYRSMVEDNGDRSSPGPVN